MSAKSKGACSEAQAEVYRIGVRRIAWWCGIGDSAVHQWLRRRPASCPIPPERLPLVVAGAERDGVQIDVAKLWRDNPALDVAA